MANAVIAIVNLADVATSLYVDGALPSAPASNLIHPQVGRKCRVNANITYVLLDLGSSLPVDTIMLAGVSGVTPQFIIRLSSVDSTGAAGDIHNSGGHTGLPYFDPRYGLYVFLRPTPLSARFIRIDITEVGTSYTEFGRIFVGVREAIGKNYQAPWSRTAVRTSLDTIGVAGGIFSDLRRGYWRQKASFSFFSETEVNDFIEDLGVAIVNEGHQDMLWIKNTASSNLSRDCIWGYKDSEHTVTQNLYAVPPLFSCEFEIRERR